MRAIIEKCGGQGFYSYGMDVFSETGMYLESDDFDTAQAAFDWLAEHYPGIKTEVNIEQPQDEP